MKQKIKLKRWVKVVITLILVSVGIVLYHFLGTNGFLMGKNRLASIFICLGWFWLLVGQIMVLYTMWEK